MALSREPPALLDEARLATGRAAGSVLAEPVSHNVGLIQFLACPLTGSS